MPPIFWTFKFWFGTFLFSKANKENKQNTPIVFINHENYIIK